MTKLDKLLAHLAVQFKEKHLTLVCAESCTGGGITYHISKKPSCSSILERGFVTYSPQSKEQLLGIDAGILQTHGLVSKETVVAMAEGALANSLAQVSLAVTGLGGAMILTSKEKVPVLFGSHVPALSGERKHFIKKFAAVAKCFVTGLFSNHYTRCNALYVNIRF